MRTFAVYLLALLLLLVLLSLREAPIDRQIRLVKEKAAQNGWINEKEEQDQTRGGDR